MATRRSAQDLTGDVLHGDVDALTGKVAVVEEEAAAGERRSAVIGEDPRFIDAGETVTLAGVAQYLLDRAASARRTQERQPG